MSLTRISRAAERAVLFAYLVLGTVLVTYPTRIYLGFAPLEALKVFYSPMLFVVVYLAWVACLVVYATLPGSRRVTMTGLILAASFGLVSSLIILNASPLGLDHNYDVTYSVTSYLATFSHIPPNLPAAYGYLSFPGLFLLTDAESELMGLPHPL